MEESSLSCGGIARPPLGGRVLDALSEGTGRAIPVRDGKAARRNDIPV
jgi:hypothetical protein